MSLSCWLIRKVWEPKWQAFTKVYDDRTWGLFTDVAAWLHGVIEHMAMVCCILWFTSKACFWLALLYTYSHSRKMMRMFMNVSCQLIVSMPAFKQESAHAGSCTHRTFFCGWFHGKYVEGRGMPCVFMFVCMSICSLFSIRIFVNYVHVYVHDLLREMRVMLTRTPFLLLTHW